MNFSNILSEIERIDPEVYERLSPRRRVIKNWMRRVSLTALPFALGSLFNKAYGQTANPIVDVLNFALTLEYLEAEFYQKAIEATVVQPPRVQLIPTTTGLELPAFMQIAAHEKAHVDFLFKTITKLVEGSTTLRVAEKPTFDFTGGKGSGTGPFTGVFSDYGVFLAVAQTLEDTGVRAYKGQAGALKGDNELLSAALRIHSIEARHAAHIRLMRSQTPGPLVAGTVNPWITLDQSNIAGVPATQPSYDGEQNTTQANIQIKEINGFVHIGDAEASEAFDEPLGKQQVLDIIDPFLVV